MLGESRLVIPFLHVCVSFADDGVFTGLVRWLKGMFLRGCWRGRVGGGEGDEVVGE